MGQIRDFFRSNFRTFWLGEIWSEKVPALPYYGQIWYTLDRNQPSLMSVSVFEWRRQQVEEFDPCSSTAWPSNKATLVSPLQGRPFNTISWTHRTRPIAINVWQAVSHNPITTLDVTNHTTPEMLQRGHGWYKVGADWPQKGQIWNFLNIKMYWKWS